MKSLLGVCVFTVAASTADAQDILGLPVSMDLREQIGNQPRRGETSWSLEALFQYVFLDDSMKPGLQNGFGIRIEGGLEKQVESNFVVRGYLALALEYFPGETVPPNITVDDWMTVPVMIGGKLKWTSQDGFFVEPFMGLGFVVQGSLTARNGAISATADSSIVFGAEGGVRLGYMITPSIGVLFGMTYQFWQEGDSFPQAQNIAIDSGVWIRF